MDHATARGRALCCFVFAAAAAVFLPGLEGFQVDLMSFYPVYVLSSVLSLFLPYLYWREMVVLAAMVEVTAIMMIAPLAVIVLTYCGARLDMPMADVTLHRWDAALGLSSIKAVRWLNQYPTANRILALSYTAFGVQILFLGGLLTAFVGRARAYMFISSFILLVIAAAILSIGFPSHAAFYGQGLKPSDFSNISEGASRGFIATFDSVRNNPHFILSYRNVSGIVTFPSVHAGVSVLCAWAMWPSRILRWPFVILNALMFVSAVFVGAHYFVDALAGGALGALCCALVSVSPRRSYAIQRHDWNDQADAYATV